MPPFRNPFGKKPLVNGTTPTQDENVRPSYGAGGDEASQKSSFTGSRASSSLSIKKREEPSEYKLSVVNDSGVYLPPSPPEKRSFWARSPNGSSTSNHRSMLKDNEPFSISRESFESYRRSFDISARSPVYPHDNASARGSLDTRGSLDARGSLDTKRTRPTRSAVNSSEFERPAPTEEETFEDVGLSDEAKQPPKKKGIFSRFGDNAEPTVTGEAARPTSSHRGFHLPGRKRGHSGQGAELGNIEQPITTASDDGVVR